MNYTKACIVFRKSIAIPISVCSFLKLIWESTWFSFDFSLPSPFSYHTKNIPQATDFTDAFFFYSRALKRQLKIYSRHVYQYRTSCTSETFCYRWSQKLEHCILVKHHDILRILSCFITKKWGFETLENKTERIVIKKMTSSREHNHAENQPAFKHNLPCSPASVSTLVGALLYPGGLKVGCSFCEIQELSSTFTYFQHHRYAVMQIQHRRGFLFS